MTFYTLLLVGGNYMNEILRTLLGLGVIVVLIGLYAWSTNLSRKAKISSEAEACDTSPQGGCCGEHNACTFEARVQKYDK